MGQLLAPLGDTKRIVEWDELPESAREIPDDFNPLKAGLLMQHQIDWLKIDVALKVIQKGRRTGITFAEALDDTITAASRKSAGGDNIYYIPDVKDKGLEFIGYCAKLSRTMAEAQSHGVSQIEEFLFADQDEQGNTRNITAYRIRFASGNRIVALSSRPANIRGLQGIVVIDEAAFHTDVQGVLDAATALLIWGGKIRIISTHNGKRNPFNQLIKDIQDSRYGEDAAVYKATFDDAVENGLFERVCLMKGWEPTKAEKKKWYNRIRAAYGPRKSAMREELDAIPRDGGGVCIPGVWIENAMHEARPVLRLVLDDDFVKQSELERKSWCENWIEQHLNPLLKMLNPNNLHVAGMDFARHRHFSIIAPIEITQTMTPFVPFVIELGNVPTRQQEQILWALLNILPRFAGAGIDATGPGQTLAEYTADKFGHSYIHQINLSRGWYAEHMPKMISTFEDGIIDLPRDINLENDLRAVQDIDGIPMVPKLESRDLKDASLIRHGDFAIALAIAIFAMRNRAAAIEYTSARCKRTWDESGDDDDDDINIRSAGGW